MRKDAAPAKIDSFPSSTLIEEQQCSTTCRARFTKLKQHGNVDIFLLEPPRLQKWSNSPRIDPNDTSAAPPQLRNGGQMRLQSVPIT